MAISSTVKPAGPKELKGPNGPKEPKKPRKPKKSGKTEKSEESTEPAELPENRRLRKILNPVVLDAIREYVLYPDDYGTEVTVKTVLAELKYWNPISRAFLVDRLRQLTFYGGKHPEISIDVVREAKTVRDIVTHVIEAVRAIEMGVTAQQQPAGTTTSAYSGLIRAVVSALEAIVAGSR